MIFFIILYLFIAILISYSFFKLLPKGFIRYFFFSIILGLISGFWFVQPGVNNLAPILSIFFLENTIIQSNGNSRLIRALGGSVLISFILSSLIFLLSKNYFRKK